MGLYPDPGRLEDLGHRVGRTTIAPHPAREGHSTGSAATDDLAYVRAGALASAVAADFFTTEMWTVRGLVTYYTAFVLDVQSRRVQAIGCTPYPDEAFVI